jgi:hypothetical protein
MFRCDKLSVAVLLNHFYDSIIERGRSLRKESGPRYFNNRVSNNPAGIPRPTAKMNITVTELQRQVQRGPALIVGPGMATSRGREAELLKSLKQEYPIPDGDVFHGTYLDYADALIAGVSLRKRMSEG